MRAEDVRSVGVVGCGIMGSGIAEICSRAGCSVTVIEANEELLATGLARIEASVDRAIERGKLGNGERGKVLGRISGATDLAALAGVDLVIEAATEELDAKRAIFARLVGLTRPEVVLASNTSSVPIHHLAEAAGRPELVIGMHFFNPPPAMQLLEIIPAETTSEETVALARAFGERLGKTVVLSKDRAGFIVNRVLVPFLNDAIRLLEEGTATRDDIDTAVHLGLAHPMGPLALADFIGLDTLQAIGEVLHRELGHPRAEPPELLGRMVSAGRLGRKSGRGFYEHRR